MPDIVSKLLHAAIWSSCAVQFESEQTPFPRIGHRLRSAALHRIRLGTWGFDPISYFYSETNEWFQHWAKQWAWLQSATTSCLFSRKFHFTWKKIIVAALHLERIKNFLTFELGQYRKSGSTCSSSKPVAASSDCHRLGKALFLASQSYLPKLCWPLILQSNPSIVFSNSLRERFPDDRHWLARAWTWTWYSNSNSAAWPMGCGGFICSETPKQSSINCVEFELFLERQIEDSCESLSTLIHQTAYFSWHWLLLRLAICFLLLFLN